MKQNLNYGLDVQTLYLEMMLADATSFVRCQSIFDHTLFDRKLQTTAEFINEYVKIYAVLPTVEIVNSNTGSNLRALTNLTDNHFDSLLTDFETFIRHKGLERAIVESADELEKGNYGLVEEKIKTAVQVGLTKDLGVDYFANPRERLLRIRESNGQISTGWRSLDQKLFGGMNRGELHVFAGLPGSGKSTFMANLGINWVLMGLNVVYITFELKEDLVSMRMDSMVTGVNSREIFKNIDDVEMRVKLAAKTAGAYQVKFMPASCKNANDVRSYLKEYEIQMERRVDAVILDYMDLMIPVTRGISVADQFNKDKFVSEELRNLMAEKNCIGITGSQLGRSGVQEIEFDQSHIAGGISKINTADGVYAIYNSREMRERGRIQLQLLKTRNSNGVGSKIDLDYNVDTLKIKDLDESEWNQPTSSPSDIVKRIKNRETQSEPLVKGQVESTKLRQLLNNLPGDDL